MPMNTIYVLITVFFMFGSFVLVLGAVSIWLQLRDWREQRTPTRAAAFSPSRLLKKSRGGR